MSDESLDREGIEALIRSGKASLDFDSVLEAMDEVIIAVRQLPIDRQIEAFNEMNDAVNVLCEKYGVPL